MTNGEFVSRIVNDIRALNKDEHISKRFILRVGRNKARFLLSQKLRDRSLFREENLFKVLTCFELEPDNIVNCNIVEFRRCQSLMKSKKKLPELLYSRYGSSIREVYSIDGSKTFTPVTLSKFRLNSKRRFAGQGGQSFYYIQDGYLYLPDSNVEVVDISLITLEPEMLEELSSCSTNSGDSACSSVWEDEFVISDKLLEPVLRDTLQEILGSYKQIVPDENPNLDENQKGKTTV